MKGIGGNTYAMLQVRAASVNQIGEDVESWGDVQSIRGWLDLSSGHSAQDTYYTKIQESTHIFIADYVELDGRIKAETARLLINGEQYDIMLIDNPMGMGSGSQLEFHLKYTGGQ